ncbi:MAG: pilus assembly protein [Nocardioidaceae bacterium]|nr:pilus assembly protein [Nocardioidaceae bacterium]
MEFALVMPLLFALLFASITFGVAWKSTGTGLPGRPSPKASSSTMVGRLPVARARPGRSSSSATAASPVALRTCTCAARR